MAEVRQLPGGISDPKIGAIQLAWDVRADLNRFWAEFSETLMPPLKAAHMSGQISCVMPFSHKPSAIPRHGTG
jgi:hypothetical protein